MGVGAIGSRSTTTLFELGAKLEVPERIAPHRFERWGKWRDGVPPHRVYAELAIVPRLDEPRLDEHPELQRHGAERHVAHRAVDGAGGSLAVPQKPEDLAAAGRGDR
jgi:hypothetical protein